MFIYYVYAYVRQSDGTPYYIGKGKGRRAYDKRHNVSVPKDHSKIVFLETNLSNVGACALERRYIRWYGRKDQNSGILYNRTDGGEGPVGAIPWNKGISLTQEQRSVISARQTGQKQSNDTIAKRVAKNIGKKRTSKFSSDQSQKMKEMWAQRRANNFKFKPRHHIS